MKRSLIALTLIISGGGCTITKIDPTTGMVKRWSLFQKVEFQEITISSNHLVSLKGYKNDGGSEAFSAAIKSAAEGAAAGVAKASGLP